MDAQQNTLCLFQPPPIEKATEKEEWIDFLPIGQITPGSVIQFNVPGTSDDYINLKKSRLHIKAKITKSDGSPVSNVDKVGLVNMSSALFRQVDVMLQQKVISPEVGTSFAWKALLDALVHNNHGIKESQLQGELYYKDTAGSMDATDPTLGGNAGLLERFTLTMNGQIVTMESPLHVDICQQPRAIINGVQLTVRMFPSTDAFRLMATDAEEGYKVIITDAILRVCTTTVNPSVIIAHNEALKHGEALYPIYQSDIKSFGIPQGSYTYSVDGIYNGQIPSSLVVGLVSSEAFAGSYHKNYANFKNYDLNYLCYTVNGNAVPMQAFTPDYNSGDYTSSYLSLFMNQYPAGSGNFISFKDFPKGYCLYAFNVAQTENDVVAPAKTGHSRLSLRFGSALPEAVTLVAYARFPSVVKIDKSRNVILPK